jgi:polyhydroxyalkanoate synthesis regulator phasin
MAEELETVLRLVAEGKLTPEEAAPIIDALTRAERASHDHDEFGAGFDHAFERGFNRLDRLGERIDRKVSRRIERAQRRAEDVRARVAEGMAAGGGRQLRIKVTERGRQVVNLRIPIGFVETALTFVPGLGGEQSQRIREAVRAGAVGPILDVEDADGEGGVLISVE